jgi:hypothetical protein
MNLLRKNHVETYEAGAYATSQDFYKLFTEDMTGLYLLSFVLTANHEKAEQCFVSGLEDCVKGNSVFKEWTRSWARRTVIKNAIRIITLLPNRGSETFGAMHAEANGRSQRTQDQHIAIAGVLALADFERFAFVMSVFERYTDKESSVLLGCSQQDVREARMRALQQIAEYGKHSAAGDGDSIQPSGRSPEMVVHQEKALALTSAVAPTAVKLRFVQRGEALCGWQ